MFRILTLVLLLPLLALPATIESVEMVLTAPGGAQTTSTSNSVSNSGTGAGINYASLLILNGLNLSFTNATFTCVTPEEGNCFLDTSFSVLLRNVAFDGASLPFSLSLNGTGPEISASFVLTFAPGGTLPGLLGNTTMTAQSTELGQVRPAVASNGTVSFGLNAIPVNGILSNSTSGVIASGGPIDILIQGFLNGTLAANATLSLPNSLDLDFRPADVSTPEPSSLGLGILAGGILWVMSRRKLRQ